MDGRMEGLSNGRQTDRGRINSFDCIVKQRMAYVIICREEHTNDVLPKGLYGTNTIIY